MKTRQIKFVGSLGTTLAARLDEPDHETQAVAIFAHCFTCSKDIPAVRRISTALTNHGFAVLRFDFTGLGQSEGDFAESNFSTNVEDLLHAADWLAENHQSPKLLIGHSLGGAAVLAASAKINSVTAVAMIGAPSEPQHITAMFTDKIEEVRRVGKAGIEIAGRTFEISRQLIENVERYTLLPQIASLHRALLVFHSPLDTVVSIDHAAAIFKAAKHPKSFVSIDRADHMLSNKSDAEFVANVLAAWAVRYSTML